MSIDKQVVACIIGDGHVSKRGGICLHHSIQQRELLEHKVDILTEFGFKFRIYETEQLSYGVLRKFIKADGYCSTNSKILRNILYPEGIKVIPQSYASVLDFKDWAIIYMDDGRENKISHVNSLIGGNRVRKESAPFVNRYEICVESFDMNSKVFLVENLNSIGVESKVDNRGRITISKASSKAAFYEGVSPYLIDSMKYKMSALPSLSYSPTVRD